MQRPSSAASSQKSVQMADIKKAAQLPPITNSLFPYFSILQRGFYFPRGFNYIPIIWIIAQSIIISIYPNNYPDSLCDQVLSEMFLFTPLKSGNAYNITAGIIVTLSFICSVYVLLTIVAFKVRNSIPQWSIRLSSFVCNIVVPLLLLPLASIIGSSINFYTQDNNSEIIAIIVFAFISYSLELVIVYTITELTSHTVFFPDSPLLFYDSHVVFFSLIFNSIFVFLGWLAQYFGNGFDYLVAGFQVLVSIYMIVRMFWLPFAGVLSNAIVAGIYISQIAGDIVYLVKITDFLPARPIAISGAYVLGVVVFYPIFMGYSKKIIAQTEFTTNSNAIRQLRVAVSASSPYFTKGKLVEMITNASKDPIVRLEVAKFVCFFREFQPQFTAQLAMLRSATNLSMSNSYLLSQLKVVETSRQPLATVEELIPLKEQTKSIEMSIRAAWKYMELNTDFSAYGIIESINVQVDRCKCRWKDVIEKYPKNALVAEEYAHFLVECNSDFEEASEWHYRALQLQDGKFYNYDTAMIHFLHIFPEYANKMVSNVPISSIEDMDVKAKEEALGHLTEQPRLKLEYQRAITSHITPVLKGIFTINIIKFIAFILFWTVVIISFLKSYNMNVTNMRFISELTKIGENVIVLMTELAFDCARIYNKMPTNSEMEAAIGKDSIVHNHCIINDSIPYSESMSKDSYESIILLQNVQNEIIDSINFGNNMDLPLDEMFEQKYPLNFVDDEFGLRNRFNVSIHHLITNFLIISKEVAEMDDSWVTSKIPFNCFDQSMLIIDNIYGLVEKFIANEAVKESKENSSKYILGTVIIYFVVFVILSAVFQVLLRYNMQSTINACKSFSSDVFDKMSSNIFIADISTDAPKYTTQISRTKQSSTKSIVLGIFEELLTIVGLCLIIFLYFSIYSLNEKFEKMSNVLLYASKRESSAVEALYSSVISNVLGAVINPGVTMKYLKRAESAVKTFSDAHQICATGYYGGVYDKEINDIRNVDKCEVDPANSTNHEKYACICLDSAAPAFINMMSKLIVQVTDPNFLKSSQFIWVYHFLNYHLHESMQEVIDYIVKAGDAVSENYDFNVILLSVSGMIISVIIFCVSLYTGFFLLSDYKTLIRMILRASPIDVVANDELMRIILNRKTNKKKAKMSDMGFIINSSIHPTVFVAMDGSIISVNTSFLYTFNYEVSHIIGQSVQQIVDTEDLKESLSVARSNEMIENGQFEEFQTKWKKENGQEITCSVNPLEIGKGNDKFVCFILTDMTSVLSRKKVSDELKRENDALASLIFPPIMNSKPEIELHDATICAIKLVQYATNLAPTEIMKEREDVLVKLDKFASKYEQIQSLGFIQGLYLTVSSVPGAAAIFLDFLKDVLGSFEDPEFFGEIMIGIDSDEDVTVFLTNEENPHVVMTGKAMSNAIRLCRISEAGSICITESVYNQIAGIKARFSENEDCVVGKYYSVKTNDPETQENV